MNGCTPFFILSEQMNLSKHLKTANWFTTFILVFAVCTGFTACSGDDDDENNGGEDSETVTSVRPSKILESEDDAADGVYAYAFEYDNQGRIVKFDDVTFTYKEGEIQCDFWHSDGYVYMTYTLLLNENDLVYKIITSDNVEQNLTYDEDSKLINVEKRGNRGGAITWSDDGNISYAAGHPFTYHTDIVNRGYYYSAIIDSPYQYVLPNYSNIYTSDGSSMAVLADQGYFGKVPQNLIKSSSNVEYDYDISDNGVLNRIKYKYSEGTYYHYLYYKY